MKAWEAEYGNHRIRIENHLGGEILIVDGRIIDRTNGYDERGKLVGMLPEGKLIVANIGQWFTIGCNLFVDGEEVQLSKV